MIFDESSFDLGEEFLAHYGVKGMRWGVRKEEELVGRESGNGQDPTSDEIRSAQLEAKYGKGSLSGKDEKGLSDKQKKVLLVGGGIIAGVAALGLGYYGLNKYSEYAVGKQLLESKKAAFKARAPRFIPGVTDLPAFLKQYPHLEHDPSRAFDLAKEVNDLIKSAEAGPLPFPESRGLLTHWDEGVELAAGTVVQRFSTEIEDTIRPDGFFAAFEAADIKRYVAELPHWWGQWGLDWDEGHLTQIKSKKAIKAPSAKQSVQILADMISDNMDTFKSIIPQGVLDLPPGAARDKAIFGFALSDFQGFAVSWTNQAARALPNVREYFRRVRSAGYDALIDFNDSGQLARTPMRFLDGSLFDIIGNIRVSPEEIAEARRTLGDLIMSGIAMGEAFLAHYGVKGMHWGIRKALPKGGMRFWANAATKTAKGKAKSPYLGIVGGYGRAAGLGLKNHPLAVAGAGAAVAALVAGGLFARHRRTHPSTIAHTPSTNRGGAFIYTNLTVNKQQIPLGDIQHYRLWPQNQLPRGG